MRGNLIIATPSPMGRREAIIVSGTPKPGTCMEIMTTQPVAGRYTFRAVTRADGGKGPICVLIEDKLQGSDPTTAYVSGAAGEIYWPLPGDELNMLLRYQSGTGTSLDQNIGDFLEVDGATGKLQGVGSGGGTAALPAHVSAPFWMRERLGVALAADALVLCQFLGNNA